MLLKPGKPPENIVLKILNLGIAFLLYSSKQGYTLLKSVGLEEYNCLWYVLQKQ